jgi:hypothetical protein
VTTLEGKVFLSYTWTDEAAVDAIEVALVAHGITVFRDRDIHTFDRITEQIQRELETSTVLLAFYSSRYPTRYACQWELTWAFLAASRLGDTADRLMLVNPESDERHIAPVDLEDAAYFSWTRNADLAPLVRHVAAKLRGAKGVPLGSLPDGSQGEFHERLTRPRRFVGRYPKMWAIRSALHGGRTWAVHPPEAHSVAVVTGPAGIGKTMLAEQYGFLFRDAYPGGMAWTDLAGERPTSPAERMLSSVRAVAMERFALDLTGLEPKQARATLATRITADGKDVLWVVDDVPADLDRTDLDALIVPSPKVHTLLTARNAPPEWPARRIVVDGLTEVEGEELFRAVWPELSRDERAAIARLVQRCQGHPMVLVPAADRLRGAQGAGALDQMASHGEHGSVVEGLAEVVRARSDHARLLLGFLSTLAPAPVSGDLLVTALADELGDQAPMRVADAIDELERHSLLHQVDHGRTGGRQAWQLHALVGAAVRDDLDGPFLGVLAARAAALLLHRLDDSGHVDLCRHATELAANPAVPLEQRLLLLRRGTAVYETRGDVPAARETAYEVVRLAGQDGARTEDLLVAARLAVTAGDIDAALRHAEPVIARARARRDAPAEYRGRFLAACAHDLRGDYPKADTVFHENDLVLAEGTDPAWMPREESRRLGLARVQALRVRGRYRIALARLHEILPAIRTAHPLGCHVGAWPVATTEHARLLLLTGDVLAARRAAKEVVDVFENAGLSRHQVARDAVTVHAESELVLALPEMRAKPVAWRQASKRVKNALAESRDWYGEDNPLTLNLAVLYGQSLQASSQSDAARDELTAAVTRIEESLGPEHPLALRALQWTGLAMMGGKEWHKAVLLFENLLPRQNSVLGREHPDCQLTRFQLGVCLRMRGEHADRKRAQGLIDEAKDALRDQHGPWHQWSTMAWVGSLYSRLPTWVWRTFRWWDARTTNQ